ncbi:hypothetical protein DY000_02037933 [Brassica cretica]|uniref:Uncharacterized protein n=1 Tax=Brassica cretica TaxID=69181 RepID=A0ABQ7B9F7_BRACR|nr:hypothetical protein DY000_02037933 [Brassica cretica]
MVPSASDSGDAPYLPVLSAGFLSPTSLPSSPAKDGRLISAFHSPLVADEISTTVDVSSPPVVIPLHVMGLRCLAWTRSQHRLMEALRSLVIWLRWCTP